MARKKYQVTLTLTAPSWLRPEAAKLEIRSRINELCGYSNGYGQGEDYRELTDGALLASNIEVKRV
jgi:hypothetical protein